VIKKIILIVLILLALLIAYIGVSYGPGIKKFLTLEHVDLAPDLVALVGYGGNSLVLISDDKSEALIVDTKMLGGAKKLKVFLDETAPNAAVTIVNTHFHLDHTGGDNLFPNAKIIAGAYTAEQWTRATRMERLPDEQIAVGDACTFTIGADTVVARNIGRGHTWNDVCVFLKNRGILHTGDLVFNTWHPALLPDDGCDISGWTAALDSMLAIEGVKTVIPGHGPVGGREVLVNMKDYFVDVQNAVGDEERIKELEIKYADYFEIPGTSSVRNSVKFLSTEN